MSDLLVGHIRSLVPCLQATLKTGKLIFQNRGEINFTVDTGFTGSIAMPLPLLRKLDFELRAYETFRLATGEERELPIYWGDVWIHNQSFKTWFVPGDPLLGMEFLSIVGSQLVLLFKQKLLLLKK